MVNEETTTEEYAEELARRYHGDEGVYITKLTELAEELSDTIDTETARSLLYAAHRRKKMSEEVEVFKDNP